jgi:Tfp pilus assembly protein PilO
MWNATSSRLPYCDFMNKTDLKKVATSRELLLAIMVLMALLLVFYRVLFEPRSELNEELQKQMTTLDAQIKSLEKEVKALKDNQSRNIAAQNTTTSLNKKVQILKGERPTSIVSISNLMNHVTQVSRGILVHSLSTGNDMDSSNFKKTPLTIKARGNYAQVMAFLEEMDKIEALVSIDKINLQMDEIVKGDINLEMVATMYQVEGIHEVTAQQ